MIKRLIFDVDNTLIKWEDIYLNALKDTVIEYNLDIDYLKINDLIEEYENYYDKYTKDNLLLLINNKLNLNLDIEFINKWLKRLEKMSKYDLDTYNTLKYLSKKYELVILSNWFIDNQKKRLENAKIKDFFSEFIDSSKIIKPSRESFLLGCGNNKIDECIMIGDNYNIDIKTPLDMGMKCVIITNKKINKQDNLYIIKNIKELKNIL